MKRWLSQLVRDDSGQDLVEYALLAALIATVSVAALFGMGGAVTGFYAKLTDAIPKV